MIENNAGTAFERIPPAKYNDLIKHFELVRINLTDLRTHCVLPSSLTELTGTFKMTAKDSRLEKGFAYFQAALEFNATDSSSGKPVSTIEADYQLLFKRGEEIDSDFLEIFSRVSLTLLVWPFCRELVHDLTQRMGLPPIVAPLMVTPLLNAQPEISEG